MKLARIALALIAGTAFIGAAHAADPIKIGLSGPFTGPSSPMGVSMRDGVKLAVDEINKAGGVMGRQIMLVERDDQANNDLGAQIAQELINKEQVVATVGFINTGVAQASERFYEDAEIPVMNNVATGSILTKQFLPPMFANNYVFRTSANDTIQSSMIATEAITKQGYKRPAIFNDSTNYGTLGRADLEAALTKLGIKPVTEEKFNVGDTDMTAQVLRAQQANADVILTYGIGPELAQIANSMAKLGWKVPMIGSWTLSMSNFIDTAGPNAEGAIMPQTFIQLPNTPKRAAFITAYQKAYNVDRMPSPVSAAQGYDSVYVLAAAITQAGSTDGPKIRAALENLNTKVEGVVTTYDHPFTATDHEAISPNMPVFGIVKGGRVVPAHPEDLTGANVVRFKVASTN
jgi:branched-chain amino acid transport system substrate-binding protein